MLSPLQLFLAEQVRSSIVDWCQHNPGVYHPSLEGGCGIASYSLWKVYLAFGFPAELVGNSGHCFLKLGDLIVDLTATQFFQAPEVYVVILRSGPEKSYYHRVEYCNQEMIDQFKTWPRDQRPFQYEDKIAALIQELSFVKDVPEWRRQ